MSMHFIKQMTQGGKMFTKQYVPSLQSFKEVKLGVRKLVKVLPVLLNLNGALVL